MDYEQIYVNARPGVFLHPMMNVFEQSGLPPKTRTQDRDIAPLLALGPEYLGFRGALCAGRQRGAGLDADAMARVRLAIPRHSDAAAGPEGVRAVSENGRESLRPAFGAGDPARPC